MATFIREMRYAARTLWRTKALSLTAVVTVAIGIGAVTSMFTVVDAVLIRSVPFPRASRLVMIWDRDPAHPARVVEVSHYTYRLWQAQSRSFSDMAALGSVNWSFELTGRGERHAVPYAAVSSSFFRTLGITPFQGRGFLPEDDVPRAARVVVVSYAFWRTVLGGDRDIVGKSLMLDGVPRTVVGVMPAAFDLPHGASMWAPIVPELAGIAVGQFQALDAPGLGVLYVLGRLRDGATAASAGGEIERIDREDAAAHGMTNAEIPRPLLTPLRNPGRSICGCSRCSR